MAWMHWGVCLPGLQYRAGRGFAQSSQRSPRKEGIQSIGLTFLGENLSVLRCLSLRTLRVWRENLPFRFLGGPGTALKGFTIGSWRSCIYNYGYSISVESFQPGNRVGRGGDQGTNND